MTRDPFHIAPPSQTDPPTRSKPTGRVSRRGNGRPITGKPIQAPIEAKADAGKLRLVGSAAPDVKPPTTNPTPIRSATDPRWVLAISTAELMQADVLSPASRQTLMQRGKAMGLTAFDCSLILAIIQDRARRGIPLSNCPAASETQLALIPLPPMRSFKSALGDHPKRTLVIAAALLAVQVLLVWSLLG